MDGRETVTLSTADAKNMIASAGAAVSVAGGTSSTPDALNRDSIRVVHLTIPSTVGTQHSVIQSVSPGSVQLSGKNSLILLNNKQSGVIQTGGTTFHNIQVFDAVPNSSSGGGGGGGGESAGAQYIDDGVRGRREVLSRRPSYRRILNELGGTVSEDKADTPDDNNGLIKVISASALQLAGTDGIHNLQSAGGGGVNSAANSTNTLVQYTQAADGQYYVPVSIPVSGSVKLDHEPSHPMMLSASGEVIEEVTKKREVRLLKNREAAKECRRKKKEYIKCLENRVAVLENQNKALIEELKSLKEFYCQKKTN